MKFSRSIIFIPWLRKDCQLVYVYIHVTLIFTVTWQVDKQLHHTFAPGVVTSSTASLLRSVVLAWSEQKLITYVQGIKIVAMHTI